ncbi:RelA/SpoT family protein [Roseinatronobacter monicus]|uniref:GTP pyrophosphokinase rsh n=1 Tax=Roseinatronobacter monicus TaxID=393481 RepID=A0A543KBH0_9RHOB|nr:RelA/SpoT family protein [Roseinatronobacter monicus]TQM92414.1 GTP pyrophosphokinase [Roseinatronobacter monicus]
MRVSHRASKAFLAVDSCESNDLFELIAAADEDPVTFFDGGLWEKLDFSSFDMSQVSFKDAFVIKCRFRKGDLSEETIKNAASFVGNKFVDPRTMVFDDDIIEYSADERLSALDKYPDGGPKDIDVKLPLEDASDGPAALDHPDPASFESTKGAPVAYYVDSELDSPSGTITAKELVDIVSGYNPNTNADLILSAFEYGRDLHEGQVRASGVTYYSHPVAVALILAEQKLDDAMIITALLHDTIEDTKSTYSEIEKRFGPELADLVDGVTKLTNIQLSNEKSTQSENLRTLGMVMAKDVRVILVKLADRLHNMRTMKAMRPDKQAQKARETMEIYAPLAGRMGMQWMREELEDLSFRVLNPQGRASIIHRFTAMQRETGDLIQRMAANMQVELEKAGIEAEVYGRTRKPFSIWRKMQEGELSFLRLSDVHLFQITTRTEKDCYAALSVVHSRWIAVPGRFKDYISTPKSTGYRSMHTTVSDRDGMRLDVQISTRQMQEVAEVGVAAHWSYRDGLRLQNPFMVDLEKWYALLSERFGAEEGHTEFRESASLEMHGDKVYCYTPKGDVVELPREATPLDFAYAIHTQIGDSCVSAKVDGLRVPLWTRLQNGQSVEIITALGRRPQSSLIDIVVTSRAKAAIRRSLRHKDRERYISLGNKLLCAAFEAAGREISGKALNTAAGMLSIPNAEELRARVGAAEISARRVVTALYPKTGSKKREVDAARPIIGLSADQSFRRAPCCTPLPGDRIIGIAYRGKDVVVHTIDCRKLEEFEDQPDRWLDLRWVAGRHASVFPVTLSLVLSRDGAAFGRISSAIENLGANISDVVFLDQKEDYRRVSFEVKVSDRDHLKIIMDAVELDAGVYEAQKTAE